MPLMKTGCTLLTRRRFLGTTSTALAAALVPLLSGSNARARPAKRMIGIQVGAVSFVDEGTEQVLDTVQERGAVDTVFLATFTYGRGIGGRQILVPQEKLSECVAD